MPEIRENNGIVTQITTVKLPPDNEKEVLDLMEERARFMATQPGFVSVSLHRSQDGSHVLNYIQWTNREKLAAAHHSPEFRKKWPRFGRWRRKSSPASTTWSTSSRRDARQRRVGSCPGCGAARAHAESLRRVRI